MEKKKNNAIEKVENTEKEIKNNKNKAKNTNKDKVKNSKVSAKKPNDNKNARKLKKAEKLKKKKEEKALKKEQKLLKRAEKEKIKAQKRVELAKIKQAKKAEKEKQKANQNREKNRRKALVKEKKAERKAQKQEKKQALKEKKFQAKKERKAEKHKAKQKNKSARRGYGGWLAAVIALAITSLVLLSVLTYTVVSPTSLDNTLESLYRKSFLSTIEQVENIDVNLSKALATKDQSAFSGYLTDVIVNSEIAENDFSNLPISMQNKEYASKIINQVGDYSKYLNKKVLRGEQITDEDYDNLYTLYAHNKTLKEYLTRAEQNMGDDYNFTSLKEVDESDVLLSGLNDLNNLSASYPELIYDGPFSDGADRVEVKGLSGEEISVSEAKDIFNNTFGYLGVTDTKEDGETNSTIPCYNFIGTVLGEELYAQISKVGGKVINFSYAGSCKEVKYQNAEALDKASEFLKAIGFNDMQDVWISLSNNVYTINYVFEDNGVIVYPDMVKVRVCAETCSVIGLEASGYYINHTERNIEKAVISEQTAKENVSSSLEISSVRKVIAPYGEKSEKLCYEFCGTMGEDVYFVYIDAKTGTQIEMFKVINSNQGQLLI